MSYHHRDFYGGELLGIGVALLLLAAFCLVKMILFVIKTFVRYSDTHRSLWIALISCVGLSVVGILLATQVAPSFCLLLVIGALVLLITCCVVSLRNRDTFMRERVSMINEILHTPWWSSEDTPCVEIQQETTRLAA